MGAVTIPKTLSVQARTKIVAEKITKAEPTVTKYLGWTLLPHSGVSLVFTGIAVNTFLSIDGELAAILSGTIVAAAIINEVIAVMLAKVAFKKAGEIQVLSSV